MFSQQLASKTPFLQRSLITPMQMRMMSTMQKHAKMPLTVRTPYRTVFNDYFNFSQLTVTTIGGNMTIGNKSIPRVYLLPPGEMKVSGMGSGDGNNSSSDSGLFMHTGGWLFVHG